MPTYADGDGPGAIGIRVKVPVGVHPGHQPIRTFWKILDKKLGATVVRVVVVGSNPVRLLAAKFVHEAVGQQLVAIPHTICHQQQSHTPEILEVEDEANAVGNRGRRPALGTNCIEQRSCNHAIVVIRVVRPAEHASQGPVQLQRIRVRIGPQRSRRQRGFVECRGLRQYVKPRRVGVETRKLGVPDANELIERRNETALQCSADGRSVYRLAYGLDLGGRIEVPGNVYQVTVAPQRPPTGRNYRFQVGNQARGQSNLRRRNDELLRQSLPGGRKIQPAGRLAIRHVNWQQHYQQKNPDLPPANRHQTHPSRSMHCVRLNYYV